MTDGIDVATPQWGLSFAAVTAAGISFVAVKAGGANVGIYTAPHYTAQVDAARAAGLRIAHYWVTGVGSASTQADYFVSNLHTFGPNDVLVLDNETLDSAGETWSDAKTAEFAARVMKSARIDPARFWLYGSASMFRAHSWPATAALHPRIWVASYGPNDGTRTAPDIGASFPAWHVHQYTSNGRVGGFTVDRNYSPLTVAALFPANAPIVTPPNVPEEDAMLVFYKEKSHREIYAVSFLAGTKRHIPLNEWLVAAAGPHTLVVVDDGALAAFTG